MYKAFLFFSACIVLLGWCGCSQQAANKDAASVAGLGKRQTLHLADGTEVILNTGSHMDTLPGFNTSARSVSLNGAAFFTVRTGKQPFVVATKNLVITIPATAAGRINAYHSSNGATVEVLQGKLLVQKNYHSPFDTLPELLQPGEMILFNREVDLMEKETCDTMELRAWLLDKLTFNQTPLADAVRKINDWFCVDVTLEGNFSDAPFSAAFTSASLQTVLDKLAKQYNASYRQTKNGQIVFRKE